MKVLLIAFSLLFLGCAVKTEIRPTGDGGYIVTGKRNALIVMKKSVHVELDNLDYVKED